MGWQLTATLEGTKTIWIRSLACSTSHASEPRCPTRNRRCVHVTDTRIGSLFSGSSDSRVWEKHGEGWVLGGSTSEMLGAQDKDQLFRSQWYEWNIHRISLAVNSFQQEVSEAWPFAGGEDITTSWMIKQVGRSTEKSLCAWSLPCTSPVCLKSRSNVLPCPGQWTGRRHTESQRLFAPEAPFLVPHTQNLTSLTVILSIWQMWQLRPYSCQVEELIFKLEPFSSSLCSLLTTKSYHQCFLKVGKKPKHVASGLKTIGLSETSLDFSYNPFLWGRGSLGEGQKISWTLISYWQQLTWTLLSV